MGSSLDIQHGGNHYKKLAIQPAEYCHRNKIGPLEFSTIKYITRHADKGKAGDVKKAIHFLQMLLEMEYGVVSNVTYSDELADAELSQLSQEGVEEGW